MIPSIKKILEPDFIRPVLLTVHQQMVTRIFDQGKDSSNQQIGEYSDPYLRRREKKGLGTSKKVILQFTGQMRNDYQLIESNGQFASGFLNQANADKSQWVEDTYDKEIFKLTKEEENLLGKLLDKKIDGALNK